MTAVTIEFRYQVRSLVLKSALAKAASWNWSGMRPAPATTLSSVRSEVTIAQ